MKKTTYELTNSLSQIDLKVLEAIYLFRCLTIRQVYKNFYIETIETFELFQSMKLKELIEQDLVEMIEFNRENFALFLTSSGVEVVRCAFNYPPNILDEKNNVVKRGYYRAGELKMLPRLINHQVHLNQFVLDFKRLADERNIKWRHFGEKYVSQYNYIRPDALLQAVDIDFFLEMDMNTESEKQLNGKWQNYRNFLSTGEFKDSGKRVIVLFIIENTKNIQGRKDVVRRTATNQLLDTFGSDFDLFLGTKEELLNLLFNKIIPNAELSNRNQEVIKHTLWQKFDFTVINGDDTKLKQIWGCTEYGFFLRKLNNDNKIVVENGRVQVYLFDEYSYQPMSVLTKVAYLNRNRSTFKNFEKVGYIVLVDDENSMYHDLKVANLIGSKDVYFTTLKRIDKFPFHEAIFQYDSIGNIHHFKNSGLNEVVFERNLNE